MSVWVCPPDGEAFDFTDWATEHPASRGSLVHPPEQIAATTRWVVGFPTWLLVHADNAPLTWMFTQGVVDLCAYLIDHPEGLEDEDRMDAVSACCMTLAASRVVEAMGVAIEDFEEFRAEVLNRMSAQANWSLFERTVKNLAGFSWAQVCQAHLMVQTLGLDPELDHEWWGAEGLGGWALLPLPHLADALVALASQSKVACEIVFSHCHAAVAPARPH